MNVLHAILAAGGLMLMLNVFFGVVFLTHAKKFCKRRKCGAANPLRASFCHKCGRKFKSL